MTREEAEREARALAREHPDRETHHWVPRQDPDGSWWVARVEMPERLRRDVLQAPGDGRSEPGD